ARPDAEHRRGALGQRSSGGEQTSVALPADVSAKVSNYTLGRRPLDRDRPACGATGARVPTQVVGVNVQAKGRVRLHGCSILRIQITESGPLGCRSSE